jgi:hypothetical protein
MLQNKVIGNTLKLPHDSSLHHPIVEPEVVNLV